MSCCRPARTRCSSGAKRDTATWWTCAGDVHPHPGGPPRGVGRGGRTGDGGAAVPPLPGPLSQPWCAIRPESCIAPSSRSGAAPCGQPTGTGGAGVHLPFRVTGGGGFTLRVLTRARQAGDSADRTRRPIAPMPCSKPPWPSSPARHRPGRAGAGCARAGWCDGERSTPTRLGVPAVRAPPQPDPVALAVRHLDRAAPVEGHRSIRAGPHPRCGRTGQRSGQHLEQRPHGRVAETATQITRRLRARAGQPTSQTGRLSAWPTRVGSRHRGSPAQASEALRFRGRAYVAGSGEKLRTASNRRSTSAAVLDQWQETRMPPAPPA